MKIKLSIVVPIYNVEKYLEDCLESIYSIKKEIKKEIILVNDESKDKSYEIIEKYKKKYPKETIVINQKNKGLSGARNSGLKKAKGKYIYFIDSDDFINTEKFIKLFESGSKLELDIIIGQAIRFSDEIILKKEEPFPKMYSNDIKIKKSGVEWWQESLKRREYNVVVWNKIYKKEFLKKNKIYFIENLLHEDIPFTFTCFILNPKIGCYNEIFYFYRQRNNSIMRSMTEKNYISIIKILKYLLELYKKNKIDNKYFNNYLVTIYWKHYFNLIKLDKKKLFLKEIVSKRKLGIIESIRKIILKLRMYYDK